MNDADKYTNEELVKQRDWALAKAREWRSIVENYGDHHEWCDFAATKGTSRLACTCGFAAILAGRGGGRSRPVPVTAAPPR